MELDRLKILVERYLEAETTLDEERELADIFAAGEDIPEEYEPVRAMFQTFDAIKEQGAPNIAPPVADEPKAHMSHRRRWWLIGGMTTIAAAAACLVVMLNPPALVVDDMAIKHEPATPKVVCYIDGKMVTNDIIACQQANKILGGMANNMQLAIAEVEKINFIIGK